MAQKKAIVTDATPVPKWLKYTRWQEPNGKWNLYNEKGGEPIATFDRDPFQPGVTEILLHAELGNAAKVNDLVEVYLPDGIRDRAARIADVLRHYDPRFAALKNKQAIKLIQTACKRVSTLRPAPDPRLLGK